MKRLIALLLLAVMLIAGCDIAGISVSTSNQAPLINSFVTDPPTIAASASSTLSWNVSGATSVSIDQGIGNVSLTGTRAVMPSATTVYTLTATNAAGTSVTATAQVIVSAAPTPTPTPTHTGLPVINYFTADPSSVNLGDSVTLRWNVSNATSIYIDNGIGAVSPAGSIGLLPTGTTTYTLTAMNSAGERTERAQVMVSGGGVPSPSIGLPVVNYFTATTSTISAGSSTTLSWNVSNATSVSIDNGVGTVGLSGSTTVWPTTSTEYILTATNASGWWVKGVIVIVSGSPSPSAFAVTNVTASVDPPFFSGPCPTTINSYAVITANGPGTATYRWEDSEGGIKPTENIYFSSAGSKSVSTSWPLGGTSGSTYSLWVRLHVLTPNETFSNQANFTLSCASASSGSWTGLWSTTFGQMQLSQTGNQVTGFYEHDNGQITGTVTGNVLYGTWAEAPTYSAANNDAGDVELTLSPDGNTFSGYWKHGSSGGWYSYWNGTRIY